MTEAERRDVARRHLDAAESWLRRLIDLRLTKSVGQNYLASNAAGGCRSIKKEIRKKINGRFESDRARFSRLIDAADLDHAITIVLHPDLYGTEFRDALRGAFPDGPAEARTFLSRLEAIRNKLAHGGT